MNLRRFSSLLARTIVPVALLAAALPAACGGTPSEGIEEKRSDDLTIFQPIHLWKTFNMPAATLQSTLATLTDGLSIQIAQNGDDPLAINTPYCRIDYTAEAACRKECASEGSTPGYTIADCLKGCQGLQTMVCTPIMCEQQGYSNYMHVPPGLQIGTKACDPNDCQPCSNGQEPALFDHPLDIPNPIATFTKGLITYHCTMNDLKLALATPTPVQILGSSLNLVFQGTTVSPGISCDNGAPDLDMSDIFVTLTVVPAVQNGAIVVTASGTFGAGVVAHDPLAQFIADLANAENQVNSHGTTAINNEAAKFAVPLGQALNGLVAKFLPAGATITGVSLDPTNGLTVDYN